ncbi:MAG TPA: CDP-alcohol phosphatidyltransferase family protein [Egibacteraceae bacterium]|nr:CDP-alcohol phosphatidyltransferase family protein [Egibacteraceae bacterium]
MRLFDAGARRDDSEAVHERVLTAANGITVARLLGLPLFVALMAAEAFGKAFGVLVAVAATDWVDGYVARRFDQVTRLGKVMDPLIDRVLLATAALALLASDMIPWWVVALVVGRDVVLLTVAAVWFRGVPPVAVSKTGKFATAMLLLGVPGFLLAGMDWPGAAVLTFAAWVSTGLGIVAYYLAGLRYMRAARAAVRMARRS